MEEPRTKTTFAWCPYLSFIVCSPYSRHCAGHFHIYYFISFSLLPPTLSHKRENGSKGSVSGLARVTWPWMSALLAFASSLLSKFCPVNLLSPPPAPLFFLFFFFTNFLTQYRTCDRHKLFPISLLVRVHLSSRVCTTHSIASWSHSLAHSP